MQETHGKPRVRTTLGTVLIYGLLTIFSLGWLGLAMSARAETREDLVKFVKEALEYAQHNPKEKVLKEFSDLHGKFVRGEFYIYAYDMNGLALAHGGRPLLAGSQLIEMEDRTGKKVIRELRDIAKNKGSGFLEFEWDNPVKHSYDSKLGYVEKVNEDWWLGSGLYLGPADPKTFKKHTN